MTKKKKASEEEEEEEEEEEGNEGEEKNFTYSRPVSSTPVKIPVAAHSPIQPGAGSLITQFVNSREKGREGEREGESKALTAGYQGETYFVPLMDLRTYFYSRPPARPLSR